MTNFEREIIIIIINNNNNNCKDKGPRSYIGPWALSEDIDRFEEDQIAIRGFQLRSHK